MFRLFTAKSAKKRTVLRKQRVKSEGAKKLLPRFSWSFAAKSLILIFFVFVIWGLGIRVSDKIQQSMAYLHTVLALTPTEWNIEVVNAGGEKLPDDTRNEIYRAAHKILKNGSAGELRWLAHQVESTGLLDGVKVIRPVMNTILVQANLRKAALLVEVGNKVRFLTADGTVFGDASQPGNYSGASSPSALVSGIFETRGNLHIDPSMRLSLLNDERLHVLDAIDIWQKSLAAGIDIRSIRYLRFRGFAIILADDSEIVLGLRPFEYKIRKLRSILDGLKRDGTVASRIELDYDGKAFIKEKRL